MSIKIGKSIAALALATLFFSAFGPQTAFSADDLAALDVHPLPRGTVPPYVAPVLIKSSPTRGIEPMVMEQEDQEEATSPPALYNKLDETTDTDLPNTDNAPVGLVDEEQLSSPDPG